MNKYSETGKIMSSSKYGLNWKEIIEHLKPFPVNLKDFEIGHIIPLHTFNLTDPLEVRKAFAPSNLQWLTREENRKKSGKLNHT
jgi:5-methylcytosine-specific restriction endonuclease McrA